MKLIARDSVFCDAQRQRKKKRKKSCKNSYSIYLRRRKTENVGRNCTLIEIDLFDSTVDISHTLARASLSPSAHAHAHASKERVRGEGNMKAITGYSVLLLTP